MVYLSFLLGFLCGLSILLIRNFLRHGFHLPLGEDEEYLLAAARAANGRLILKQASGSSGATLLLLKEFPNPRRIEKTLQIEKLLARKFIQADASGTPGRYTLTATGREFSQKLPEFPLRPVRPESAWFNVLSRRAVCIAIHSLSSRQESKRASDPLLLEFPWEPQLDALYCAENAPLLMMKEPPWRFVGHRYNGLKETFSDRDIVSLGKEGLLRVYGKIAKITPAGKGALHAHRGALIKEINQLTHGDDL